MSDEITSGAHLEGEEELKVYELGYLLVPTVPEEHLAGEVQKLKDAIVSHKGTFVSEDAPKLRTLAYTIVKHVAGRNVKCDRAYFGWVKFVMDPGEIIALTKAVENNDKVLRHLLIKTVKESTLYGGRLMTPRGEGVPIQTPKKVQKEELTETTIAEIDKSIENLIIE